VKAKLDAAQRPMDKVIRDNNHIFFAASIACSGALRNMRAQSPWSRITDKCYEFFVRRQSHV
jgi:hypothetical protein